VKISNEENGSEFIQVIPILNLNQLLKMAKVISDMKPSSRLNTAKSDSHLRYRLDKTRNTFSPLMLGLENPSSDAGMHMEELHPPQSPMFSFSLDNGLLVRQYVNGHLT
jgi:hypothetical protein